MVLKVDIANVFNIVFHKVIFLKLHDIGGQLFQLICFICSFYVFQVLLSFNHHSPQGELFVIKSSIGTRQKDLLGGPLFALIHFQAFRSLVAIFQSCLFFFIVDDTHIIGLALVVYQAFHHFFSL